MLWLMFLSVVPVYTSNNNF